jgi:hypothetical protein
MKRLSAIAAALLLLSAVLLGQSTPSATVTGQANGPANVAGQLYAANFAHWTATPTELGTAWTSRAECFTTSGGLTFPKFSTNAPITIVDLDTSANTETVTPTFTSYSGSGCTVGLPATHSHTSYYLQSGTLGLQEVANWAGSSYAVIVVTPDWVAMGGTGGMISAAVLGTNTTILDERTNAVTVPNPLSATKITTTSLVAGGTAAVVTSGCSTCSGITGGALVGTFTPGTTSAITALLLTPGVTAPHGFACSMFDLTSTTSLFTETATSTTTATFAGTAAATTDKIVFTCLEY